MLALARVWAAGVLRCMREQKGRGGEGGAERGQRRSGPSHMFGLDVHKSRPPGRETVSGGRDPREKDR